LRNRLAAAIGRPLPSALLFDYPTPSAVARHLRTILLQNSDHDVSAHLDWLETGLPAVLADEQARLLVTDRLTALLTRLRPDEGAQAQRAEITAAIGSNSDQEIFELIDTELMGPPSTEL
jgi:hypothetical protein